MAPTLTSEAWTQIRFDYEHSERPIAEICAEHGISSGTLRDRMRRWGWRRRRPPIPREGPPPLPVEMRAVAGVAPPMPSLVIDAEAPSILHEDSPHPAAHCVRGDPPHKGEGQAGDRGATYASPALPIESEHHAPGEIDDGTLVPRLKGAVARLLPAIEATVARLAAGAMHPREMERAGRALGALTRTLRELNALLGERQPPAPAAEAAGRSRPGKPAEDDDPRDTEELRQELIRRINAVIAAREENARSDPETASEIASENASGGADRPRGGPQVRSV